MPLYSYRGYDKTGSSEEGTIDASSEQLAFEILKSRGVTVFHLAAGIAWPNEEIPWYRRDIRLSGAELSYQDQAIVAGLLATLFRAGLPVADVIRIAGLSADKKEVARHFERVGLRVADGANFPEAFRDENHIFSPVFVSFLKISDTANSLPALLYELSGFFQKQYAAKQKVISALIYPSVLVCASVALFLVIVLYLAPNLSPIFASVGREVPATIGILLSINLFLKSHWPLATLAVISVSLSTIAALQLPQIRSAASILKMRLPVFGSLLSLSTLTRLVQSTELLLRAGNPLSESLRSSAENMGVGTSLGSRFLEAADAVEGGRSAASIFDQDPALPSSFKELFRVGETTNNLPVTLLALSEHLSSDLERKSERLLGLITPALTLIMGTGIGFLIYTLMAAILEVNDIVL
ncbi:type II secretion system F family protein [Ruegeria sp.]|uniref:type II secretion system F family protein n=1 Tax=Ruegeria sp. TaxID=1879320 RepID=UPI003C79A446